MIKNLPSHFIASLAICFLMLSWYMGWAQVISNADDFFLSRLILVFAIASYTVGFYRPNTLYRTAEVCASVGFIGTLIGMGLALEIIGETRNAMNGIPGVAIAIHTSIVGAISALLLNVHRWLVIRGGEDV